jgi:uncharacterized membrane protein YoaK (UPF0700 family)
MNTFISEMRQTVFPHRASKDGPLPPLLVALTFVTGLVDAFSYLVLGHVFVANMTGNVVFLGFALVGAPGFSIGASVVALASFWLGALVGGNFGKRHGTHRGRLLSTGTGIEAVFIGTSVILAALSGSPVTAGYRYALIAVLALALGVQNAAARQIAVPDLTTTVLTLTITGMAADSAIVGGKGSKSGRRLIAVAAMLVGAIVGAVCVLHVHIVFALVIALLLLVIVGVTIRVLGRTDPSWADG